MRITLAVLAAAVFALQLRPVAAGAQTYPDATTGCSVHPVGGPVAPVSLSLPGGALQFSSPLGPLGPVGIESWTWLASLSVARDGRGLRATRAPERSVAAYRRRVGPASR